MLRGGGLGLFLGEIGAAHESEENAEQVAEIVSVGGWSLGLSCSLIVVPAAHWEALV